MTEATPTPAELRTMFSANLKRLASSHSSITDLSRNLGINRTQFNRYLAAESFPRPDVLNRICTFFNVDARILLQPLAEIPDGSPHPWDATLAPFLGPGTPTPEAFPLGFYRATEQSPDDRDAVSHRLYHAKRVQNCTLLRGFCPVARAQGRAPQEREVRGFVASAGHRLYALVSHRGGVGGRMYLLSPPTSSDKGHWVGHTFPLGETADRLPVPGRLDLSYLGQDLGAALHAARTAVAAAVRANAMQPAKQTDQGRDA